MAQHSTFFKSFHSTVFDYTSVIGNDLGWLMLSQDSSKVYQYNSCGELLWAKKYALPNLSWSLISPIKTKSGGFAFLEVNYNPLSSIFTTVLVNADDQGNVIWCKLIQDTTFFYSDQPMSLLQDDAGNFYLYQYLVGIDFVNLKHCSLTKISETGNVIWSNIYLPCINSGEATITKNNGILMRSGNTFTQVDTSGAVLWSTIVLGAINTNNWWFAPVEVEDGYIFYGTTNATSGGNIIFYKLDKNGIMQWGGGKKFNYNSTSSMGRLYSKYNGNFIFFNDRNIGGGRIYGTWTEFDKELNVVNQGAIRKAINSSPLFPDNISFLPDSSAIMSGIASTTSAGSAPRSFFLKVDKNQHYSCDTTLQASITPQGGTQNMVTTVNAARSIWTFNQAITVEPVIDSTFFVCTNSVPLELDLGPDTSVCEGKNITLKNKTNDSFDVFLWSTGETSAEITVTVAGSYWLRATNSCSRERSFDTIEVSNGTTACEILIMPNIFTPNNDAVNDTFLPIEIRGITAAHLKIFNRWGQEVYATSDILMLPWTGVAGSKKCPDGVYYWIIDYTNYLHVNKVQKGSVNLFTD